MNLSQSKRVWSLTWTISLVWATLSFANLGKDFEYKDEFGKGQLKASIQMKSKEMSIYDTQYIIVDIQAPAGFELEFPGFFERFEDYTLIPWRSDDEDWDQDLIQIKKYIALQTFETGTHVLPKIKIKYSSGHGEQQISGEIKSPALRFDIQEIEGAENWNDPLPDLAPIEGLPIQYQWKLALILIGSILGLLIILGLILFFFLKPKAKKIVSLPAHELAYREIHQLVEAHKQGNLNNEQFADEASQILRRYIERRFELNAPELTTEEFLEELLHKKELSSFTNLLKEFLVWADEIKFAAFPASTEELQKSLDNLKHFIESTLSSVETRS